MRYYSIVLKEPSSGSIIRPKSLASLGLNATWTSFVNGQTIPGAQNVELNVPTTTFAEPVGAAYVRVWGVSLEEIGQANDLRGKSIEVYAGMQKGLPLAKPEQSGLILQGTINQAFGNWIGTDMTLDMIVVAGTGSQEEPKNIVHKWKKGTKLTDAIKQTLATAFPDYKADIQISPNLVLTNDDIGYYQTVGQYAEHVKNISSSIIGGGYHGVRISLKQNTFSVFDGTTEKSPIKIAFEDMIGQPTWIDPLSVQFKTAMRADISVGDFIKFPPAITTQTEEGAPTQGSTLRSSSVFQGTFMVTQMTHFGNFRQPDAASWNTTFNVSSTTPQT
jgi:hypothetical protein